MKAPHLLGVTTAPARFHALFDAAREVGLRVGWLDLVTEDPVAPGVGEAADLGAARSVAAGPQATVAVKRRKGPAVLHDLLREHFLGCCLVLVRGALAQAPRLEAPPLAAQGPENQELETPVDSWTVTPIAGPCRTYSTAELIATLRRPHPWPTPKAPAEDPAPAPVAVSTR